MAMDLSKSYEYFQPEKVEARINIVGCGSVGATLAENLVRLGITNLALWDMDVVNPHNLANQIFRQQDIGRPKVEALADILFEINPEIKDDLKLYGKGWSGQQLSGYVFLCVDNIELRRQIVEKHFDNPYEKLNHRNHKKDDNHLNKHAMHLIRLYLMCLDILEKGDIITYRGADLPLLMSIRRGDYQLEDGTYRPEFFEMVSDFEKRLDYAKRNTNLPEHPDMKRVEEFVVSVNRRSLDA